MIDTKALQVRFADKIRACIVLAEAHYKRKFSMPKINYNSAGTTAGTADYSRWQINISWPLFIRNIDETIDNTGPHELAHLIDHEINPENHSFKGFNVTRTGRVRRVKRDIHGDDWRAVCRVLGMSWDEITRCHDMDTSETKRITSRSRTIDFKCACGHVLQLSEKMALVQDLNPHARYHKGCRGRPLVRATAAIAAPVVRTPAAPYSIPKTFIPPTTRVTPVPVFTVSRTTAQAMPVHRQIVPTSGSKMDICTAIFRLHSGISRGDMIAKFVNAGCTPAGASTYYQSIKKKLLG